ncbi:MAG: hypothetical protein K2Y05_03680 [Hyphomicrobiaceae bacterium]|nr:hypothetical protein [Hyphomicrobiaceae bacterium]
MGQKLEVWIEPIAEAELLSASASTQREFWTRIERLTPDDFAQAPGRPGETHSVVRGNGFRAAVGYAYGRVFVLGMSAIAVAREGNGVLAA